MQAALQKPFPTDRSRSSSTGFPTGIPGLYAASYTEGIVITGGTGRFQDASRKVYGWGAVDTSSNEVVLRYEGTVCYPCPDEH